MNIDDIKLQAYWGTVKTRENLLTGYEYDARASKNLEPLEQKAYHSYRTMYSKLFNEFNECDFNRPYERRIGPI